MSACGATLRSGHRRRGLWVKEMLFCVHRFSISNQTFLECESEINDLNKTWTNTFSWEVGMKHIRFKNPVSLVKTSNLNSKHNIILIYLKCKLIRQFRNFLQKGYVWIGSWSMSAGSQRRRYRRRCHQRIPNSQYRCRCDVFAPPVQQSWYIAHILHTNSIIWWLYKCEWCTCCRLSLENGNKVETWNMISWPSYIVYTDVFPVMSPAVKQYNGQKLITS